MYLFLNTSLKEIDVMVFDDKKIYYKNNMISNNNHTINLYNEIEKANINLDELKRIYYINGPGSYTGLRVTSIFVKTLAIEKKIKLYPINLGQLYDCIYDDAAIDLKGQKYYYKQDIISKEMLNEDILIDPTIDLKKIFETGFLLNQKESDPFKTEVFYAKKAL